MTEIALIADIHGNRPALDAVAADLAARSISDIYCLGDTCGRGPEGAYAYDWCKANCSVFLQGNWEEYLAAGYGTHYTEHDIGQDRMAEMGTLPLYHRFWLSGRRVHLLHGRPLFKGKSMTEDGIDERIGLFSAVPDEFAPDIVGYADIHRQYKHDLHNDPRVLFNTGSVGNSFSTNNAHYVILRGELDSQVKAPFSLEFVSVPYDVEQAVSIGFAHADWFDAEPYSVELRGGKWNYYRKDQEEKLARERERGLVRD